MINNQLNRIKDQNVAFYDEIAADYDLLMEKNESNRLVREKVAASFRQAAGKGRVLDFGGGTGQDMRWLTDSGYSIIHCEPSPGMREKAIRLSEELPVGRSIQFLDDTNADFRRWKEQLPFEQPVEGVLSNFAAINCIPDLPLLFESLALVLRPGGALVVLVLQAGESMTTYQRLRQWVRRVLRRSADMGITYRDERQAVYLHPVKVIQKAASEWFEPVSVDALTEYGFNLLHFRRI